MVLSWLVLGHGRTTPKPGHGGLSWPVWPALRIVEIRQFQQIWQRQVEEPNLDWVDLGLVWWARPTHLVIVGGCGLSNHGRRVGGAAFWCR